MGTDMTNTNPARKPFDARGRIIWAGPSEHDAMIGEVYDNGQPYPEEMAKIWAWSMPIMFPALANIRNVARRAVETDRYETKEALLTLLAAIAKAAGDALPVPTIGDLNGAAPTAPDAAVPTLRECPCCAGPAYPGTVRYNPVTVRENGWSQDTFHSVSCAVCGLEMSGTVGFKTPEAAAEAWNRREAELPALKVSTEALARRPDYSHLHPEGGRFSFAYSPDVDLQWVGWRFDDREAAHQFRMMLDSLRQQPRPPAIPSLPDPLERVVSPDGEWLPRMWDLALGATDSEAHATAITLKMVAASHGYRAAWVRQEVPDALSDASPATILEQVEPSTDAPPGCLLVGRTMDEDGIVNWYVRPVEDVVDGGAQS